MNIRAEESKRAADNQAMPARGLAQHKCACGGSSGMGRSCASCQAKDLDLTKREPVNSLASSSHAYQRPGSFGNALQSLGEQRAGHEFGRFQVEPSRSAGRMSMHVAPAASPSRSNVTEVNDEDPGEQTISSGTTSGNRIDITFDPTTTTPRPQCDRIIQTQWIRMMADGAAIMPGTYYTPWVCRNPTCLTDATYLDHGSCAYTTPYPVDRGIGTAGSSNGTVSNATYFDAPTTGGGDRGFNSAANPTGWQTVTYLFGNYAFCAAGTDCGTWYDGIAWNYTKTAADAAAGRAGVATGTASLMPPGPGSTIISAFDQYNSAKGFTPCMYSSAGP